MAVSKPNKFLNPDMIADRGLKLLHQQANFIGHITRGYDDRYAKRGAKIGNTLKIRLPNRFASRDGATYQAQPIEEKAVSLVIDHQAGVDMSLTSADMTTSMDDFEERLLRPAMSQVVSEMERKCLEMVSEVYSHVDASNEATSFLRHMLACGERLDCHLAPRDGKRVGVLAPVDGSRAVDGARGLYNPVSTLSRQYREGLLGKTAGLTFFVNTHVPQPAEMTNKGSKEHTKQVSFIQDFNDIKETASGEASQVTLDDVSAFKPGDVFTFPDLPLVHPETKRRLYYPYQGRVTAVDKENKTVTFVPKVVGLASEDNNREVNVARDQMRTLKDGESYQINLFRVGEDHAPTQSVIFHPEAFCLATADMQTPQGVDFAARKVLDGISMRVLRAYDIHEDLFRCRIDVLYGIKVLRPELAVRLLGAERTGWV
ncbi:MAG: P22 phage major capsid protein family protein [Candidatus Thiodiazotropha sp.]